MDDGSRNGFPGKNDIQMPFSALKMFSRCCSFCMLTHDDLTSYCWKQKLAVYHTAISHCQLKHYLNKQ